MNLLAYRKKRDLSQAQLAEILTTAGFRASQALISQWESGGVVIPAERCVQIETITQGLVRRGDLRPDLFGVPADDLVDAEAHPPSRRSGAAPAGGDAAEPDEATAPVGAAA